MWYNYVEGRGLDMQIKTDILKNSNEQQRNIIITALILLIFVCLITILYFALYRETEVKRVNRMPFLELYGNTNIILKEHESYIEYGYYAYDLEDGNLTKKVTVQTDLDVNKPGTYTLTYIVNDQGQQSAIKTRTVIVESEKYDFNFDLKGAAIYFLRGGNRFTEPGFLAIREGQNLNESVKVIGEVDGEKDGIYTLYYVCEHSHQVAVKKRTIIVSSTLSNVTLNNDELEYISKYNIKELKENYKIIPEHFSSKTMLILAFSLCENSGALTDDEIISCLDKTFDLKNREISHLVYYDLIKGNISYNDSNLKWNVSSKLLLNQLEDNLESLKTSMKLALSDDERLYVFVENKGFMYRYMFIKKDANYLFASVDVM
jgi:hypothetical protein